MLQNMVTNSSKVVKNLWGDDVTYLARNFVTRTFFTKTRTNVWKQNCFCYGNVSLNSLVTFVFTKHSVRVLLHTANYD
jgi:hypothetical protein